MFQGRGSVVTRANTITSFYSKLHKKKQLIFEVTYKYAETNKYKALFCIIRQIWSYVWSVEKTVIHTVYEPLQLQLEIVNFNFHQNS